MARAFPSRFITESAVTSADCRPSRRATRRLRRLHDLGNETLAAGGVAREVDEVLEVLVDEQTVGLALVDVLASVLATYHYKC